MEGRGSGNVTRARMPRDSQAGRLRYLGERLGRSRDDRPEARGQAFPPVNELVDPDVHLLADRRHAVAGRVEGGDVRGAQHGGRADAQDTEVVPGLSALADRDGGADDGVLTGVGRTGELERDRATRVGDIGANLIWGMIDQCD